MCLPQVSLDTHLFWVVVMCVYQYFCITIDAWLSVLTRNIQTYIAPFLVFPRQPAGLLLPALGKSWVVSPLTAANIRLQTANAQLTPGKKHFQEIAPPWNWMAVTSRLEQGDVGQEPDKVGQEICEVGQEMGSYLKSTLHPFLFFISPGLFTQIRCLFHRRISLSPRMTAPPTVTLPPIFNWCAKFYRACCKGWPCHSLLM